jgi:hypothetical protein
MLLLYHIALHKNSHYLSEINIHHLQAMNLNPVLSIEYWHLVSLQTIVLCKFLILCKVTYPMLDIKS